MFFSILVARPVSLMCTCLYLFFLHSRVHTMVDDQINTVAANDMSLASILHLLTRFFLLHRCKVFKSMPFPTLLIGSLLLLGAQIPSIYFIGYFALEGPVPIT